MSEVAIKENGFDPDLTIGPSLLQVENGGAYSEDLITVKVPYKVPDGHFPVGFYYDPQLKDLECVPVMNWDDSSVTLGVRHFSSLGIGTVPARAVEEAPSYNTGFRPGVDDFNMVNNGSTLEPAGHCAGQCLAMLWYYKNRKLAGQPSLWNRFDNYGLDPAIPFKTPSLQHDDVMALRLASTTQKDANRTSAMRDSFYQASELSDTATFQGIIYAMRLHKAPQYLEIRSLNAAGATVSAHAIIAYRAENNRIYIADPNYPGQTGRYIELIDGKIQPYSSARTAEDAAAGRGILYTRFYLVGVSALFNHQQLDRLWQQLDARTIGSAYFPDSNLDLFTKVMTPEGEKEEEIVPGYQAGKASLEITRVLADTALTFYLYLAAPDGTISNISKDARGIYVANLKLGDNYIGVLETKQVSGKQRWHHFRWIKVSLPFPFAGTWQGTVHFDTVKLPAANPSASTAIPSNPKEALSIGCDQIPLELHKQLLALEGTSKPIVMAIAETATKDQFKAVFNFEGTAPGDPLTSEDSIVLQRIGNQLQGEIKAEKTNIVFRLRLEPDGATADALKGNLDVFTTASSSQGFFTSLKMARIGE